MTPLMSANTLIEYARNRGGEHPIPESYVDRWVPGWREVGDQGLSDLAALAEVDEARAVKVALKFLAGEPDVVGGQANPWENGDSRTAPAGALTPVIPGPSPTDAAKPTGRT